MKEHIILGDNKTLCGCKIEYKATQQLLERCKRCIKKAKVFICAKEIGSPKGAKTTPSKLLIGHSYLLKNLAGYRTIMDIGVYVVYTDSSGYGMCTKASFASACPYEATVEEIKLLGFLI